MHRFILTALISFFVPVMIFAEDRVTFPGRAWAKPGELRSKKLIDAGIYTMDSQVNATWLADHPEFTTTHPFDGIAIRLPLSSQWCKKEGLPVGTKFDDVLWKARHVPAEAVAVGIADMKRTKWGPLTDNFLWWNLRGGKGPLRSVDLDSDEDWKVMEQNARLAARICKEGNLKGLLFDTEQYSVFPGTKTPYPFGKAKPEILRQRGQALMNALQKECPNIVILFTFAWAPDLDQASFLAGVKHFINGMLEGIEGDSRLVHGYENTFYFGQVAGSRFTKEGFRGDRARYEEMVSSMRKWSTFSSDPNKFAKYVRVGMAAWLESDPWNLWSGWPSGTKDTIWSNLPLALAYSEEYVWCWSEHTNFMHTLTDPVPGQTGLNPFLASLTNQTFNTGKEAATQISEKFETDPLARGWYFDFDMLDVARRKHKDQPMPILLTEGVPYRWNPGKKQLEVGSAWTHGPDGKESEKHDKQRRRFVHPVRESLLKGNAEFDFTVTNFGHDPENPIIIGVFHSDKPANQSSISVRIGGPDTASILVSGTDGHWESKATETLKQGQKYRFRMTWNLSEKTLEARLSNPDNGKVLGDLAGEIPSQVSGLRFDEIGIAQADWTISETPSNKAYSYQVNKVNFKGN